MTSPGAVMSAPTPDERHLQAFRRILLTIRAGRRFSVNDVRDEVTATGLAGDSLGALFQHAARRGWIEPTGWVVPSRERVARGRCVREYRRCLIGPQKPVRKLGRRAA